jgi:hypothetical protein
LEAVIQKVQKAFPLLIEPDANLATLQDFIRANAAAITTSVQGDSSRAFLLHSYIRNNPTSGELTKLERRISAITTVISRTPPWLVSGWGCRGRRPSKE